MSVVPKPVLPPAPPPLPGLATAAQRLGKEARVIGAVAQKALRASGEQMHLFSQDGVRVLTLGQHAWVVLPPLRGGAPEGSWKRFFEVVNLQTGQKRALLCYRSAAECASQATEEPVQQIANQILARFQREVAAYGQLANVRHTIQYFGSIDDPSMRALLVEHCPGGELLDWMNRQAVGRVALPSVLAMIHPIAEAVQDLHAQGFVHRDLKPENVLLDAAGRPRLADFDTTASPAEILGTGVIFAGTELYWAPELQELALANRDGARMTDEVYDEKFEQLNLQAIDMWAFGAMLAQVWMNVQLSELRSCTTNEEMQTYLQQNGLPQPKNLSEAEQQLRTLILQLLLVDPNQRPTAAVTVERLAAIRLLAPALTDAAAEPDVPPLVLANRTGVEGLGRERATANVFCRLFGCCARLEEPPRV